MSDPSVVANLLGYSNAIIEIKVSGNLSRRQRTRSSKATTMRSELKLIFLSISVLFMMDLSPTQLTAQDLSAVTIEVEASKSLGKLRPIWRYFGADEPNYAYMKDGKKLLSQIGELSPKQVYFRTHNLLTTGPGAPALKWGSTNAYTEDADGNPIYDWKLLDLIFDTYLENGVRPYVQIGFMPKALSTKPDPYEPNWRPGLPYERIYTGWTYPPKDYDKWMELVYQWTKHCLDRYGAKELESWYWETWNEPNIGYWKGTREEFFKTHDYAIAGVLKAFPTARVGGPDTAGDGGNFAREFYRHCLEGKNFATGETGTKIDFVSFHAKGSPNWVDDHIQMGIAAQLKTIETGFKLIAEFPELKTKPIIIGESDPEGCAACQGNRFTYRNGTMYSSYTAASFARKHDLADRHQVNFEGALTWAFTFEDQPYFTGFRQLASNGIPMPVFNVFRMFSKMNGDRIAASSSHQVPLDDIVKNGVRKSSDVGVLASRGERQVAILVWHYHDDDLKGPDAKVKLGVSSLPDNVKTYTVDRYVVDQDNSNSFAAWQKMGSPIAPDQKQYDQLQRASELKLVEQLELTRTDNIFTGLETKFSLQRQGVALVVISW